jgi:hypothetical protein
MAGKVYAQKDVFDAILNESQFIPLNFDQAFPCMISRRALLAGHSFNTTKNQNQATKADSEKARIV